MENNNQNNLKTPTTENAPSKPTISDQDTLTQNPTPNLNKKRDDLMFNNKITNEVSSYLKEMGGGNGAQPIINSARSQEEKRDIKQSIVRTYKSDAEEAIKMEKMSSASIAIAEEKKRRQYEGGIQSIDYHPKSKKVLIFIASLLFMLGGIGAFNFNYVKEKINSAPVYEKDVEISSLIAADSSAEINLTKLDKKEAKNALFYAINETGSSSNSIKNIYFTKNVTVNEKETKILAEPREFLTLISSKTPDIIVRSLSSQYMLGVHYEDSGNPFIILKTDSYENGFAGMLSWEKSLASDLELIFPRDIMPSVGEGGTTTDQILTYKKDFEDILVKNKDARALRDENNNIFLIYSLPDKETIIITSNTGTLAQLFDRFIRARAIR